MKKKSMDDPIKRRWRNKEYIFISRHKKDLKRPKDWMVAFLPGGDAGLFPTELEIFDKLGAQRSNLVGLENDKDFYRRLKSRKLGINLELVDAEDFFRETNQKFDIISLDYSGQFSFSVEKTLKYIAGRQLLNNRAILATNLYGRMEQPDVKSLYERGVMLLYAKDIFHTDKIFDKIMEDHIKSLEIPEVKYMGDEGREKNEYSISEFDIEKAGYDSFEKIRKVGITSLICGTLTKGKGFFQVNPVYKRNPQFKEIDKYLREFYFDTIKKAKEKNINLPLDSGISIVRDASIHGNVVAMAVHDMTLSDYMVRKGHFPDMLIFPMYHYNYPYFVEDLESYWYRSERGSPMYSDFFYVDQHREIFEKYKEFTDKVYRDLEDGPLSREKLLEKNISSLTRQEAEELILKRREDRDLAILKKAINRTEEKNLPKRIFLGSSSERPKLDGKTYYEHRIESLKRGQKKEKLWKSLKKIFRTDIDQLRAYERHFNMQTYGPNYIEKEIVKRNFTLPDLFNSNHPYGFLDRLPKETEPRLNNFLDEDLKMKINLAPEQKNNLINNIANSKWYKIAEKEGANESQIYRFFDDIMLYCIWNGKAPDKETIKNLLYNSLSGEDVLPEKLPKPEIYAPEIEEGGEKMSPRGKPYISKEAALTLLAIGQDPREIARGYSGFTAGQLRAFKAHLTMNTYDKEFTSDLAYELFGTCGLTTEDVRKAFPNVSTKRIGAYKAWDTMRNRAE